jgi:hypothetical protein
MSGPQSIMSGEAVEDAGLGAERLLNLRSGIHSLSILAPDFWLLTPESCTEELIYDK